MSSAPPSRRERQLALVAGRQRGGDAVADAVAVPADQPGALAGVGRRQPLADERVEQRRLAGLDPSGDRHPHRPAAAARRSPRARARVRRALDELLDAAGQLERPGRRRRRCSVRRSSRSSFDDLGDLASASASCWSSSASPAGELLLRLLGVGLRPLRRRRVGPLELGEPGRQAVADLAMGLADQSRSARWSPRTARRRRTGGPAGGRSGGAGRPCACGPR